MGLLDRERQKRAREERRLAREAILREAATLFEQHPYEMVELDAIAGRAKVKKGIPSLLFQDKEGLFLEVFLRHLEQWAGPVRERLEQQAGQGPEAASRVLARALGGDPRFGRLLAVLHNALERNLSPHLVVDFSERFRDATAELGRALETACGRQMLPDTGSAAVARLFAWGSGVLQVTGSVGSMSYLKVRSLWPAAQLDMEQEIERLALAALAADPPGRKS
jgi:AcrR family transcriptional regulator